MTSEFKQFKYIDDIPKTVKIKRLIWSLIWFMFFKSTPRWCLNNWRIFLLKLFGAKIGKGCRVLPSCFVWAPWNLSMGEFSVLGDNVDCYISKFFPQQKNGNSTKWHQDNYYFKGSPEDIVSCAIYLTDTTIENGCLRIAKNTHKFDKFLDHTSSSGLDGIKWINEDTINKHEIVDLVQKGPYAVFFNINIAHGCYTNTTEKNRYSLAWEYINSSNSSVVSTDQKWCDRTLVTPKYLV